MYNDNSLNDVKSELLKVISRKVKDKGLTQKAAAKIAGVTQPRISNITKGRVDIFTLDKLFDIAEKLGVQIYYERTGDRGYLGLTFE